jgi:hypothetical protein
VASCIFSAAIDVSGMKERAAAIESALTLATETMLTYRARSKNVIVFRGVAQISVIEISSADVLRAE